MENAFLQSKLVLQKQGMTSC